MSLSRFFRKIDHLVRYFFVLGFIIFALYHFKVYDKIVLFIIGCPFMLAYQVRTGIAFLPKGETFNHFGLVLPVTVAYFTLVGALLKTLWNERGKLGTLCFGTFVCFLIYIHHLTGKNLLGYFFTY